MACPNSFDISSNLFATGNGRLRALSGRRQRPGCDGEREGVADGAARCYFGGESPRECVSGCRCVDGVYDRGRPNVVGRGRLSGQRLRSRV